MKIHNTRSVSIQASALKASLHVPRKDRIADIYGFVASENARGNYVTRREIKLFLNLEYLRTMQLIQIMEQNGNLIRSFSTRSRAPYVYTIGNLPRMKI